MRTSGTTHSYLVSGALPDLSGVPSIQIQEDFERGYRESIERSNTLRNIPDIIDELDNKNEAWDEILEKKRKKI